MGFKNVENFINENHEHEHDNHSKKELKNYMFFQNLRSIKSSIEKILELNEEEVDNILHDHDWASDHISSSQDDVEEVSNFLCDMLGKNKIEE